MGSDVDLCGCLLLDAECARAGEGSMSVTLPAVGAQDGHSDALQHMCAAARGSAGGEAAALCLARSKVIGHTYLALQTIG